MKNYLYITLIILGITISPFLLSAQNNINKNQVEISPLGMMAGKYNKLRIRYQYLFAKHISAGIDVRYFTNETYPGYQLSPYVAYHFLTSEDNRLYIYGTYLYGKNKGITKDDYHYLVNTGIAVGGGVQVFFGAKKNFVFDTGFGIRKMNLDASLDTENGPPALQDYLNIGPGTFIEGIFAFGMRF